jgi:anti-sigma factor RsiW
MVRPCANLEAWHHRDLDDDERSSFDAHLPGCSSCRAGLESLRAMDDQLRSALSPSWNDLSGKVRGRLEAGTSRTTRIALPHPMPRLVGLAAAAALLVGAVYLLSRPKAPAPIELPPPVSKAVEPSAPPPEAPIPAPQLLEEFPEPPVEKPAPVVAPPPAPVVPPALPAPVERARKPSAPSKTVVLRAHVEKGKVYLSADRTAVTDVLSGQEIITEGAAVLAQTDATRLEIGPESRLFYPESRLGVHLAEGIVTVDRAAGEETVCTTPQAEVRYESTRFSLISKSGSTRVLMAAGSAKFLNLGDGGVRHLKAGQFAVAPAQAALDQRRIDEAIKKGLDYVKGVESIPAGFSFGPKDSDELILLTYAHAGLPETDPKVQELLAKVLDGPLESTYEVSLLAMALEEFNRVKYQLRIWQCAQFLVDNQCKNGQWSYGKPTVAAMDTPTGVPPATATGGAPKSGTREFTPAGSKEKPKVVRKIPVRKTREGIAGGDNSNSQYAALGLRACHDAGILLPKEVLTAARNWWVESQIGTKDNSVSTGKVTGVPQGWCYRGYHHDLKYCKNPDTAYASMTAGGVGALAILDSLLGREWKSDKTVLNGLAWLAKNWSWTENVGPSEIGGGKPKSWLLYHFYAVERMGMLLDTPKVGDNDWYLEGASILLDAQKPTGAWTMSDGGKPLWDTCFAILFLKRATRPLDVASEDRKPK